MPATGAGTALEYGGGGANGTSADDGCAGGFVDDVVALIQQSIDDGGFIGVVDVALAGAWSSILCPGGGMPAKMTRPP